jgi:hypothetical protein
MSKTALTGTGKVDKATYYSSPATAEIKNAWSYTSMPHTTISCLIKGTYYFSFTVKKWMAGSG